MGQGCSPGDATDRQRAGGFEPIAVNAHTADKSIIQRGVRGCSWPAGDRQDVPPARDGAFDFFIISGTTTSRISLISQRQHLTDARDQDFQHEGLLTPPASGGKLAIRRLLPELVATPWWYDWRDDWRHCLAQLLH